ncbi:hypothetical protein ACFU8X_29970 [Brevibacillus porteri]|uniref:hypothetical protein n=1 Tax=Brevibacillus porteri TaxID=2126350 RepID=UPI00370C9514
MKNEVPQESVKFGGLDWKTLDKQIRAAYQVRSSYVHTGQRFSEVVQVEEFEVQVGRLHINEGESREVKKFLKALNDAPTFNGLERMMRYCLIRFLESNGAIIFPSETTELETM